MKAVYKYPITAEPTQKITLPAGAHILSVGLQGDDAYLWALVDTNGAPTARVIVVLGTGHDASDAGDYIGTVFPSGLVFHVFTHRVLP